VKIVATGLHFSALNARIHEALAAGEREFALENVLGQRYIGAGLGAGVTIEIDGVPGNDLAAFMNGAHIVVRDNCQDGTGNTMNAGRVVVEGDAGDIIGHSMRGGEIFVRGSVGYRAGIHMKAFHDRFPALVIGEEAGEYLGEYMAGGILAVLNVTGRKASPVGEYVGTGMHGGVIYVRGTVEPYQLGAEVGVESLRDEDWNSLRAVLGEYCRDLRLEVDTFQPDDFIKLFPKSTRPYGRLYAY
jgi:glutamate synthase domain-containing protein 3